MEIICTCGDANGVGLEVLLKSIDYISQLEDWNDVEFTIAVHLKVLKNYAAQINFPIKVIKNDVKIGSKTCKILPCSVFHEIEFGEISEKAGRLASQSLELAIQETIEGKFDAIVTMPVSKSSLYLCGWKYPGQTEFITATCYAKSSLMILASGLNRMGLTTIHLPLKYVAREISKSLIINNLKVFNQWLVKDLNIKTPKIAVLALNPHAGEGGSIGIEEIDYIAPAIIEVRSMHITASGPFPADGFFGLGMHKMFDGILAMYHDQGLIPIKLISGGDAVNVTAGLPIVRTSPGHGTAFDIAGLSVAKTESCIEAIRMAREIVENRKKNKKNRSKVSN
ncbi:MAG: 4-hydroxythreonine-4-phosphate dehydrogenase [Ignavibacteria bacterium]|nr:4-hydroxythreonine-4-phosphate dehydrogenase [Ignavibacteria bacterium]